MRNWKQVSQLKLFGSCQGILVDDERGRITYIPGFVDAETAQAWFTELRRDVKWRSQRREMYDREVDVPRLLGHFRLDPAPDATPTAVLEAAGRVVAHLGVPFNSVGLNCTVTVAIAWHHTTTTCTIFAKGSRSHFFHWAQRGA